MPRKRGGSGFGPETAIEQGALTCPNCHGGGRISRPQIGTDRADDPAGNMFDDDTLTRCPECGGTGKVRAR